jgi:hypothetical protein
VRALTGPQKAVLVHGLHRQVFRKAANGQGFLERAQRELGMNVRVVSRQ